MDLTAFPFSLGGKNDKNERKGHKSEGYRKI